MSKYDKLYMDIAETLAQQSHAKRLKVGAVLVKNGSIIAEGWNGTPSGWDNHCEQCCEHGGPIGSECYHDKCAGGKTKPEVLHAESNALMKVARSTQSSEGATIYTLYSPCIDCAKLIVQSGIIRVVYRNPYRDLYPISFLETCNVKCEKITKYERTISVG